jgi:hypothetical protein
MANELTYLETQKAIDEFVNMLVTKKGYAYSCGVLSAVLTCVSISAPQARQEIVDGFKRFVDSETKSVENK